MLNNKMNQLYVNIYIPFLLDFYRNLSPHPTHLNHLEHQGELSVYTADSH